MTSMSSRRWVRFAATCAATIALWGCEDLSGDDPGNPDASGSDVGRHDTGRSDTGTGSESIPIPDHPAPETPGVDEDTAVLMAAWGTAGSDRREGVSRDGHARCDAGDIDMSDLLDIANYELATPAFPYPSTPVHDEQARCGADGDTMLWRLMNCERISRDLTPYRCDLRVLWAARRHTADQIAGDFMSHTGSDGSTIGTRASDANISWSYVGENVAAYGSILSMHHGWMDSSGHRANILSTDFTHGAGSVGPRAGGSGLRGTEFFVRQ